MAIQISGTTVIDNSRNLPNLGFVQVGAFADGSRPSNSTGRWIWNSTVSKLQISIDNSTWQNVATS